MVFFALTLILLFVVRTSSCAGFMFSWLGIMPMQVSHLMPLCLCLLMTRKFTFAEESKQLFCDDHIFVTGKNFVGRGACYNQVYTGIMATSEGQAGQRLAVQQGHSARL